ncbi:polyphosphate--glucose phosphotransferase [Neolewinella antarctica]|uniref:Polyphosphate glucokinase n=1 Tax=Neolewinella antarctica TaxID=442734 RepID=A0ABX0XED0_9BACT|nr:ROK family protein [Neolewinella antarctica]NJC27601.1 polyphosphate glucokinase [Neolewinella antarctica]
MKQNVILGIDVGATGIKGGLVDVAEGRMVSERHRLDTPTGGTPAAMAQTVKRLVDHFSYDGPVGVGFPAIVSHGVARSAANIDESWIGANIEKTLADATGLNFFSLNDADAAGIATMEYGIGKPYAKQGTVIMVTIGTGLGGALFVDGELMPNFEVGQLFLRNHKMIVEKFISNRVRKDSDMGWKEFGKKFQQFISHVDQIFSPDLIVLGGGASKHFTEYERYLKANAEIKPATLQNTAGTIGAAVYAARKSGN